MSGGYIYAAHIEDDIYKIGMTKSRNPHIYVKAFRSRYGRAMPIVFLSSVNSERRLVDIEGDIHKALQSRGYHLKNYTMPNGATSREVFKFDLDVLNDLLGHEFTKYKDAELIKYISRLDRMRKITSDWKNFCSRNYTNIKCYATGHRLDGKAEAVYDPCGKCISLGVYKDVMTAKEVTVEFQEFIRLEKRRAKSARIGYKQRSKDKQMAMKVLNKKIDNLTAEIQGLYALVEKLASRGISTTREIPVNAMTHLSRHQAARYLGVSLTTFDRIRRSGEIVAYRPGDKSGVVRFLIEDLDMYIKSKTSINVDESMPLNFSNVSC